MKAKATLYFDKGGPQHSQATLEAAKERALEIKPVAVVVTSSSGKTALEAARVFAGTGIRVIAVPFQKHMWDRHRPLESELAAQCHELGVEFLPDEPILSMLDDRRPDIVNAWRMVSQGFKVALQVASMCVDIGLLEPGAFVLSFGGSSRGTDTAIAVHIYGYEDLFKSKVTEIVAMPSGAGRY